MFPTATCSTYALVPLLARWSQAKRTQLDKGEAQRVQWHRCFQAFIATFVPDDAEISLVVYADMHVVCSPGLPLSGEQMFDLHLQQGMVLGGRLQNVDYPLLQGLRLQCEFTLEPMPILDFFSQVHRLGVKGHWLLKQFAWHVGTWVEGAILAARDVTLAPPTLAEQPPNPDIVMQTRRSREREHRTRRQLRKLQINVYEETNLRRTLLQYYWCARRTFHLQVRLPFAFDASRVGKRSMKVGFMADPQNRCCWMPPQATGGTQRILTGPASNSELENN